VLNMLEENYKTYCSAHGLVSWKKWLFCCVLNDT
jgi:hypothetical protein